MERYSYADGWRPTEFQEGAIEAAFFTCDPFISPGEYYHDWDNWDALDDDERGRFIKACEAFETRFAIALPRACELTGNDMAKAGRDYHYTSQGHGCGFWDGDWDIEGWGSVMAKAFEAWSKAHPLPEITADVDCHHYHETGSTCGECGACEARDVHWYVS